MKFSLNVINGRDIEITNTKINTMKNTLRYALLLVVLASCGTSEYRNSNNSKKDSSSTSDVRSGDTSKGSSVGGYPAAPAVVDSTSGQSGKMSNTFRDSVQAKQKK